MDNTSAPTEVQMHCTVEGCHQSITLSYSLGGAVLYPSGQLYELLQSLITAGWSMAFSGRVYCPDHVDVSHTRFRLEGTQVGA